MSAYHIIPSRVPVLFAGVLAVAAGTCLSTANAEEVFPKGQRVSVFAGYSPGGTNDIFTRTVARYIGGHLPGEPTTVVRNMPGAGSLTLAMYLYNQAPRDGTEFGLVGRHISTESLLSDTAQKIDSRNFTWMDSPTQETLTCVAWHTSPVQDFESLKHTERWSFPRRERSRARSFSPLF